MLSTYVFNKKQLIQDCHDWDKGKHVTDEFWKHTYVAPKVDLLSKESIMVKVCAFCMFYLINSCMLSLVIAYNVK